MVKSILFFWKYSWNKTSWWSTKIVANLVNFWSIFSLFLGRKIIWTIVLVKVIESWWKRHLARILGQNTRFLLLVKDISPLVLIFLILFDRFCFLGERINFVFLPRLSKNFLRWLSIFIRIYFFLQNFKVLDNLVEEVILLESILCV